MLISPRSFLKGRELRFEASKNVKGKRTNIDHEPKFGPFKHVRKAQR